MTTRTMKILRLLLLFSTLEATAQTIEIKRIEPLNWWTGMKDKSLSLLLYGPKIGSCKVSIKSAGLSLKKINPVSNPNYLFLDLEISPLAKAGIYIIELSSAGKTKTISYELKDRKATAKGAQGYGPEDVIYMIMPDRFANGDTTNDFVEGMLDRPNRTEPFGRHGGDLKGIQDHLDYIKDLGATALWLNPVIENNQPHQCYHGYAFTDFYKIDPRFGSLNEYKKLTAKCHSMGLKMIQDMVANHIGSKHWWMEDMPDKDWVHPSGEPLRRSNFRIETVSDPNGSRYDKGQMVDGWFDQHMPDLNQKHPLLAKYLIQNSLWWIAEIGIDGIRMDTYPYNDKDYMSRWCDAILHEFPGFGLVGEIWVDQPSLTSYYTKGALNQDGYKAGLPTVTDFPTYFAITKGLNEKATWDHGLIRIYTALAQDFLYKDASKHVIFLDNHDVTRFFTSVKSDYKKFQQGMAMLFTLRGVPQMYYGGEILMTGDAASHPEVRKDFPGGWPGDPENYFLPETRKGQKDSAFRFTQKLLKWRKTSDAIKKGKFIQYLPENNVYAYFRIHEKRKVLVLVNGSDKAETIKLSKFKDQLQGINSGSDVISDAIFDLKKESISLAERGVLVIDCEVGK